jgi:predicted  nucleic acid-binding Zn-ribbon protein
MDGNKPLSVNMTLEVDQAQSIRNVQKAVNDIGKKTTMEVGGLKINFDDMAKEFNKFVNQSFKMGKNNELTSMTTQLMNQYGQIMTVQHKVLEDGTMQVEQTKIATEALKVQKARYEEIRQLYEKVGKLQAESVSVSKKKQESIASEVKETQKLIREKEKALKAKGLTNSSLQNSTIEKQKLENARLLTKEEEKLDKKRTSAYAKLQKSLELIHKYNMQSVNANEQDLVVLEKKKAVATSLRNSAQGAINRGGLSDNKLNEQITQLKEIQALELRAAQQKAEQKTLNDELIALDSRRLATKKQLEQIGDDDNARAVLEKQLEEQSLAVFQKRAEIEQKGLMTQQTENTLLQKQLDLENQIEVSKAKQLTASQKEQAEVEKLIARTQKSMGVDVKNSLNKNSKYITSQDLVAVEKFQQKLKQLNGTSLKDVRSQISDLKLQWKEINSNIQANKLKQTSTAVGELGQSFKYLATYVSGAMIIRRLWNELKKGITHIKEVDQAFTNMSMTMESLTKNQFNTMLDKVNTMSKEMGAVSSDVLKIAQTFANDSTTIEAVMAKLAPSTALMNISGMQATDVTKSIMSIANSYQMLDAEGRNAAEVTEYLGDVLSKVSANMDMDFQEGLQGLVNGIGVAGSTMKAAGVDMEWFVGQLGNAMVATGQSADKLGRGMRTITARVMQQKQALEELGESTEGIELEFAKGEKALKQLGITIRDTNSGELKSFSSIMDELGGKWKNLSDSTKYYMAEQLAGKNQMDIFIGMMDSYDTALGLVNNAYDAQGTLMEMNGIYADSLQGKLNTLKSAQQELFQTFINTDGFKSMIDGFTGTINGVTTVIDKFGALPTVIATSTMGFLSFNNAGKLVRDNIMGMIPQMKSMTTELQLQSAKYQKVIDTQKTYIDLTTTKIQKLQAMGKDTSYLTAKLQGFNTTLKASQIQLVATTVKTVALQAAMSMGLSIAISAVVTVIGKLIEGFKNYTDYAGRAKEATENISNLSSDIQSRLNGNIKETISKLDEMIKKYNDINTSQEEKAELSSQINTLKQELIGYDNEYASILENENLSYQEQLGLIKQINKEKALENAKALDKELDKQSDLKGTNEWYLNQLNLNDSNIKELEKAIANAVDGMGVFNGQNLSVDKLKEILSAQKEAFQEHYLFLLDWNGNVQTMLDAGWETDKQMVSLEEYAKNFEKFATEVDKVVSGETEAAKAVQTVDDKISALTNTFSNLSNEQLKYADTISDIRGTIQELGGDAEAQATVVQRFLGAFPQYEGVVENVSDLLGVLGDKATIELGKAQAQAKNFLETMKDMENYTPDVAEQLIEAYPELAGHIQDTAYVQEFLNDKISEMDNLYGMVMNQVDVHRTAQEEILANDAEFWNEKMKNSENFLQYQRAIENKLISLGAESLGIQYDDFAQYVESKGGLRDVDYSSATSLAEAENMTEAQKLQSMLKMYSQYVNEKDGYRSADSELINEFLNWQGGAEAGTIEELAKMWASFYNAKKKEIQNNLKQLSTAIDKSAGMYQDLGNVSAKDMAEWNKLNAQLRELDRITNSLNSGNLFSDIKTTFKGTGAGTYKGGSLGSSGLNTKPSSGSSSSSSTEKIVEDLDLVIDRYYELNDAIDDVNNALEMNRQLQKMATNVATTKKLHEEEIKLLNEKLEATKKLQLEQRNDMLDHKNLLSTAGFSFDGDGNLTNYSSRLKELQNYANSLSGDAKEAQIAYVNSIVDIIDAYTTLTNDSLPSTELAIEQLIKEIEDVNKEHEKTLKLVEALGDRYYEINGLINDVDKKLALNQAKQENANASERVRLMEEEIALMKEKQDLLRQQSSELQEEAEELAKKLSEKGVEFNADGTVANYKELMDKFKVVANDYVGEYRDEVLDEAEELIDLIKQYDDIIRNTLPDLEVEWEEYTTAIREAEKAMAQQVTDIQKDITSAIQNELQKRTEAVKTELQKQKDAYNKQFDEEDWEDSLTEQQRKLDEIQQAINSMSRDTSLAGKLKLQQLREEYEAQQKVIDDMIRDKEKENGNNRFDEEMEKAEQELEEALDAQNIADLVNKALVDGFVTIGDEIIQLDTLMTDWLNETGDGLYAIGNTLREELIENLRVAQELMAGMGITSVGVSTVDQNTLLKNLEETLNATLTTTSGGNTGQKLDISIGSLVEVQGNVTEDVLPKLESMISTAKEELIEEIASELMKR